MMQQVQDGCSHNLGFTDFGSVQSSCDVSGQTSSFLSILKPGSVSEGDPELFYCYRSMKPRITNLNIFEKYNIPF